MNNRSPILNFSVRDRAGGTLIETDFPRLAARAARRNPPPHASRLTPHASRPMAKRLPPRPMATRERIDATRGAVIVAAALALAVIALALGA